MNPMVFTILSWEKDLETHRQTHPQPYNLLEQTSPAPQAPRAERRPALITWLHLPWRPKARNTTC